MGKRVADMTQEQHARVLEKDRARASSPHRLAAAARRYMTNEEFRERVKANAKRRHDPQGTTYLLRNYGITAVEFWEMYLEQNCGCAICDKLLVWWEKAGCHVDHDHVSGAARGLLCGTCNTGLGKLGDNAASLRRAVTYLEAAEKRNPHD